ncbi:hypothetical protein [Kaistella sp.]|uniref:hypothetical protein n=1 Tax=Kaistella sp. TaxID=2782235 RepID=UPI003C68319D
MTLRFIDLDEGQDSLGFVDAVFEVLLPYSEFIIPEDERFGAVHEGLMKFALIRFFDGNGLLLVGKTAVMLDVRCPLLVLED